MNRVVKDVMGAGRVVTVVDKYLMGAIGKSTEEVEVIKEVKGDKGREGVLMALGMCVMYLEEHLLAE